MFNPALFEMATNERVARLRHARGRSPIAPATGRSPFRAETREPRRGRRGRVANPQETIGWLLVSIGLRLVVPRARALR